MDQRRCQSVGGSGSACACVVCVRFSSMFVILAQVGRRITFVPFSWSPIRKFLTFA